MVKLPENLLSVVEQNIMDACRKQAESEPRRNYLGMSGIGHPCLRKIWLDYNGYPKSSGGNLGKLHRIFRMGHVIEDLVKQDLRAAGYEITDEQLEFTDFDGRFRGHCDGIIKGITQKDHILEIKSASKYNFEEMTKHGVMKVKPEYAAQIQLYMAYAGLERGIFVVECKNTQDIYTERVHFDRKFAEEMKAKAEFILNLKDEPEIGDTKNCYCCDYHSGACKPYLCETCIHKVSLDKVPGLDGILSEPCKVVRTRFFCREGKAITREECAGYVQS
jgi:hypothetical protein